MKPISLVVLCLLVVGLSACGNKGSLVLPGAPAAEAPPLDAPEDGDPEPETLNDANQEPVEGEGSEGGDTTPPPAAPAR